jgi:hypothetical protein
MMALIGVFIKWPIRKVTAGLTLLTIRKETEKIMRELGKNPIAFLSFYDRIDVQFSDGRFTAPWAARGDYIPAPVPLVRARVADTRTAAGKNAIIVAYKPRDIPLPWENVCLATVH